MQHLNTFKTVSPPTIPSQPPPESDTGHPRRSAYAAMHDLQAQFSVAGIETEQVWEFIKTEHSVDSRSNSPANSGQRLPVNSNPPVVMHTCSRFS